MLPIARAIAAEDERYVSLPEPDPHEDYRLMSRFASGVEDPHARQRLEDALDGRGAFGRFRRVLGDYPKLRDQWHARLNEATRERALEWLAELGIEAVEMPRAGWVGPATDKPQTRPSWVKIAMSPLSYSPSTVRDAARCRDLER